MPESRGQERSQWRAWAVSGLRISPRYSGVRLGATLFDGCEVLAGAEARSDAVDAPSVDPALAFADRQHGREAAMLLRSHRPTGPVIKHVEAARCPGEQDDMRTDTLFAADTDVEIARVPAGGLQRLHLDHGNVFAVAGTALQR